MLLNDKPVMHTQHNFGYVNCPMMVKLNNAEVSVLQTCSSSWQCLLVLDRWGGMKHTTLLKQTCK
jgi:hypothetical protein